MGRLIDGDALEVVTAKVPKGMDAKSYMAGMEYVLSQIDAQPTIEQRKTGKWIKKDGSDLLYCSECGLPTMHRWPYCEQCGAMMEGEQP